MEKRKVQFWLNTSQVTFAFDSTYSGTMQVSGCTCSVRIEGNMQLGQIYQSGSILFSFEITN